MFGGCSHSLSLPTFVRTPQIKSQLSARELSTCELLHPRQVRLLSWGGRHSGGSQPSSRPALSTLLTPR